MTTLESTNGRSPSLLLRSSGLLSDTKVLLAAWDMNSSVAENLDRALTENIFGKRSRAQVKVNLAVMRRRYFDEPEIGRTLVALMQGRVPQSVLDPLLYYYSLQADLLLRAVVLEVLVPRQISGYSDLQVEHIVRALQHWSTEGKTAYVWNERTIRRMAQGVMATLRDFSVLQGTVHKAITPIYLPNESFAFIAFDLWRKLLSGERVLNSDEWKLFFLPVDGVERFFLEAHQERLLTYEAAGSVIRLEFPAKTLEEYGNILIARASQKTGA
jgi:hypothetical protein